jgi:CheY-like chemotaxis protein
MEKTIYIADDSTVTRMFISNIVKDIPSVKIFEFTNGEEVIAAIKKKLPDLLILDSVMPIKDGLSVLKELKEFNINIPIIFCTADIQSTTKEKAMLLGISEFINKPIQKDIIFEKANLLLTL